MSSPAIVDLLVVAQHAMGDIIGHAHSLHYGRALTDHQKEFSIGRIREELDQLTLAVQAVEDLLSGRQPHVARNWAELREQLKDSVASLKRD